LTPDLVSKDYPALRDPAEYGAFKRKWQYLFAYADAGFAKGYTTCHMFTFIREVPISTETPSVFHVSGESGKENVGSSAYPRSGAENGA